MEYFGPKIALAKWVNIWKLMKNRRNEIRKR